MTIQKGSPIELPKDSTEALETKLQALRQKWRSWPKSHHDPRWWRFKCDETLAIRYKNQIAILKRDERDRPLNTAETEAAAQMIFGEDI